MEKKFLTFREASAFLDISLSYLYKLTSNNVIPHHKPGRKKIYFLVADLEAYVLSNRIEASPGK